MNPLHIVQGFDDELYSYFEKELEHQHFSLSFIPDENCISPTCSAMMGNVLVNSIPKYAFQHEVSLRDITKKRVCDLFGAEYANIDTASIETASHIVMHTFAKRGDVILSLDLRKQEYGHGEEDAYKFINYGVDPKTHVLDLDSLESMVKEHKPSIIVISPVCYPLDIDYARCAKIAQDANAILWCDISHNAGLIASKKISSPVSHADVVTFSAYGALQGPQAAVILAKQKHAEALDKRCANAGYKGLGTVELAALSIRFKEMQSEQFAQYCQASIDNAKALAEGLKAGGVKLVGDSTANHLVVVDTKSCAQSDAQALIEVLEHCNVLVRGAHIQTTDANVIFDVLRFSTLPLTSRSLATNDVRALGEAIGRCLTSTSEAQKQELKNLVRELTLSLPIFSTAWLPQTMFRTLDNTHFLSTEVERANSTLSESHDSVRNVKLLAALNKLMPNRNK